MGVCKQTVDLREYRLGLCHLVYFLELGVDGGVNIRCVRGGPLSVSDVGRGGVPCVVFSPAGRPRFVRQASNASALRLKVSLVVRRIGDTVISTNEVGVCGLRDATPSVNTSSTPLMHHKTPISGEGEVGALADLFRLPPGLAWTLLLFV
jgi:hypothetical protein